jgi:hypothetical protein
MRINAAHCHANVLLLLVLLGAVGATALADVPSILTLDERLPNPHRPYEMTSDTVHFGPARLFGLYDLKFQATNPEQVGFPLQTSADSLEFESIFDITYDAQIGIGLGPVHPVRGVGTAHVRGKSTGNGFKHSFDTEILSLNLECLSGSPQLMLRESPTLRSSGITTWEDTCPQCDRPFAIYRVSSFFDIFAEVTVDGGQTWLPAEKSFEVVQSPKPVLLGDYNENGEVDAADYVVWRENLGRASLPNEIGISPGIVDKADYGYWRSRFGAFAERQLADLAVPATPEPATSLLVLLSTCALPFSRMR